MPIKKTKKMKDRIKIEKNEILSKYKFTLKKITFQYQKKDGTWQTQIREAYNKGNGATIMLYNREQRTVILTRQFRMPIFDHENESGMLIEACAGILDEVNPEDCIKRETLEETGYQIKEIQKIFEAYMCPGAVTELLHFYIAEYSNAMKINEGGGLEHEEEEIEVLEMDFDQAIQMIENGAIKDGKTIMLLQYLKLYRIL